MSGAFLLFFKLILSLYHCCRAISYNTLLKIKVFPFSACILLSHIIY
ncbi:hypothetical protein HMPREF1548_05923 [Clostridium sp. KLE 1755]|nr:hypothetical protein HMPREF1548_05923 [Clostridium sp. KLE 1755]